MFITVVDEQTLGGCGVGVPVDRVFDQVEAADFVSGGAQIEADERLDLYPFALQRALESAALDAADRGCPIAASRGMDQGDLQKEQQEGEAMPPELFERGESLRIPPPVGQ